MLTTLAFVFLGSLRGQGRAFTFLSYQDTIFAVYLRGWTYMTRDIEPPRYEIDLKPLGLSRLKGTLKGTPEDWDPKGNCFDVACVDFEHVLGYSVKPRYERPTTVRDDLKKTAKAMALKIFRSEFDKRSLKVALTSVKNPNVYSVDLDGSGHSEILVDISAESNAHSYGLAFLYSSTVRPVTLAFKIDGWPRILSVVDLAMDRDRAGVEDVIVGGTTNHGKCVSMWRFKGGQAKLLAGYDSPP